MSSRGAPRKLFVEDVKKLDYLLDKGFTISEIASKGYLGKKIHRNTINKFLKENDLYGKRARYYDGNEEILREMIRKLHNQFPKSGYCEMQSPLRTNNPPFLVQREKVRKILVEVDPLGASQRLSTAVKRRVYTVPSPNFLWHLDSNHKLIRWNFVIHGCIDGYSRYLMTLKICTNNLAKTAYQFFEEAMSKFGIPSKIRVDGGGEFNFHESFMNSLDEHKRCLRGKSVHNTRIERLWRDCREKVLDKYILTFDYMEKHNVLDISNNIQIFALHFVFKKRINQDLEQWQEAHNNHPIRTEKNKTPVQLWLSGSLLNRYSSSSAMQNLFLQTTEERQMIIHRFGQVQNP